MKKFLLIATVFLTLPSFAADDEKPGPTTHTIQPADQMLQPAEPTQSSTGAASTTGATTLGPSEPADETKVEKAKKFNCCVIS